MLRLLHTADVHLGARHEDLGEAAQALRERQHAALRATVDLALAEHVDAVLIAGDLFDANTASRKTVERVSSELGRLAAGRIRIVLIPGDHDAYSRSSVYRAYDLNVGVDWLTVLTPDHPWVRLDALDAIVLGPSDPAKSGGGPFADPGDVHPPVTWRIGLLHAGRGDGPEAINLAAIGASGLDLVALGHEHIAASGRAGTVTWAVAGAPEQIVVDRGEPGTVNLITLDDQSGAHVVTVEPRVVGSAWHRELEVEAGALSSQNELVNRLRAAADPELVLDVRIAGDRPDDLELDPAAVEEALRGAYLSIRVEDRSRPPLTAGALPPPETIAGAFIRNVEARIAELEATDTPATTDEASELREVLRLGRRLLAGAEVAR